MKMPVTILVALLAAVTAMPAFADARSDAKSQVEFGINVAQRGLWREAIYRWEKATQLDPTYVAAYNEAMGAGFDAMGRRTGEQLGESLRELALALADEMRAELHRRGMRVNHKRVLRLMQKLGLLKPTW